MTTHDLKVWPVYFERLLDGTKTFDVRKDDRNYQAGDILILREWQPELVGIQALVAAFAPDSIRYTGRQITRRVGFVAKDRMFGLNLTGYAVMSLLPVDDRPDPSALAAASEAIDAPVITQADKLAIAQLERFGCLACRFGRHDSHDGRCGCPVCWDGWPAERARLVAQDDVHGGHP